MTRLGGAWTETSAVRSCLLAGTTHDLKLGIRGVSGYGGHTTTKSESLPSVSLPLELQKRVQHRGCMYHLRTPPLHS